MSDKEQTFHKGSRPWHPPQMPEGETISKVLGIHNSPEITRTLSNDSESIVGTMGDRDKAHLSSITPDARRE